MQEIMQFAGNHTILSLAWVVLLVLVIITTFSRLFSKVKTISRSEAIRQMNKEEAVVVDIRGQDDFRKGHIANAINVLAAEIKKGNHSELDKAKSKPVIVVCATGTSAVEAAKKLSAAGFEKVSVLKEGISGWSSENFPLVRGK
ncbi:MAG: putative protein YibN [Candidatus Erwinia impunctatus]|nr:putative protein YibN [Culicoides impunctatus]